MARDDDEPKRLLPLKRWCVEIFSTRSAKRCEVYCGDERTARTVYRAIAKGASLYPSVRVVLEHREPRPPATPHPILRFRHRVEPR